MTAYREMQIVEDKVDIEAELISTADAFYSEIDNEASRLVDAVLQRARDFAKSGLYECSVAMNGSSSAFSREVGKRAKRALVSLGLRAWSTGSYVGISWKPRRWLRLRRWLGLQGA